MKPWNFPASRESIERTIQALTANGIEASLVESKREAKQKVLDLLPSGAEVFTMTSVTLDSIGLSNEINEKGKYNSIRNKLNSMDRNTQGREMRKLVAAPDFAIGSAHAVTETGTVMVASLTGSQLSAYAYGSGTLIWVVGVQKIVADFDEGLKRISEYTLPFESERAKKAYGVPGSFISKLLIFNREVQPGRAKLIFINEAIGF